MTESKRYADNTMEELRAEIKEEMKQEARANMLEEKEQADKEAEAKANDPFQKKIDEINNRQR